MGRSFLYNQCLSNHISMNLQPDFCDVVTVVNHNVCIPTCDYHLFTDQLYILLHLLLNCDHYDTVAITYL